ncbi:UNVERIFIED_CONTAM: hypothetical protein FKN15_052839 [Acipenser sinensis]
MTGELLSCEYGPGKNLAKSWVIRHHSTTLDAAVQVAEGYEDILPPTPFLLPPTNPDRSDRHIIDSLWTAFLHINGELGRPPVGREQSTPPCCQTGNGTCRLHGCPFTPHVTGAMRLATSPGIVQWRKNVYQYKSRGNDLGGALHC